MVNTLVPPFRFNTVEQQIYRGGYPTLRNFRFLRRLQLRTIVSVIPEPPTSDLIAFCSTEKIQHYYFKASKFTSDVTNLPLYVHCLDGGNVTGLVIMMLRKLQNWNLSKFAFEFCQLSTDQTIEKEESEYVATFAEEILIPQPSPEWLWQNLSIQKHPTLKIKFDKGERDVQDCISTTQEPRDEVRAELRRDSREHLDEFNAGASRSLQALDIAGLSDPKKESE